MKRIAKTAALLPLVIAALPLCGCGTKTEMTKQEQANFKGGPMPPGYLQQHAPGLNKARQAQTR
jgi:hypothetical protein